MVKNREGIVMKEYDEVRNQIIAAILHEMRGQVDDTGKLIPVAEKIAHTVMRVVCENYCSNTEVGIIKRELLKEIGRLSTIVQYGELSE